jgi:hypothetical protein
LETRGYSRRVEFVNGVSYAKASASEGGRYSGYRISCHQSLITSHLLWGVDDAAEADGGGAVAAGGYEEKFFVLVEAVGLREIPDGA